jgi:hypothetical protein
MGIVIQASMGERWKKSFSVEVSSGFGLKAKIGLTPLFKSSLWMFVREVNSASGST